MKRSKDILIIPRNKTALRFIELPSVDFFEIKDMVELQTIKEFPYPKEDLIVSFRNLGSYKRGFSYILLVIAKKQHVEEMLAEKGGVPDSVRLETELLYLYLLTKGIIKQDKVSLVINIEIDRSEIMILDGLKPVFSRGLNSSEDWLDEINRTLLSYKRDKGNKDVEELIVMYGSNLNMENMKSEIKEAFSIPLDFYEHNGDLISPGMPLEIGLLPTEYIDKRSNMENAKQALVTFFLLLAAVSMLAGFFVFKTREKNEEILMLTEETDKMQKEMNQLNSFLKKTELLKYQKEEGGRIVDILKECYALAPKDIFLEGFDCEGRSVLYCKGKAREMPSVFNFIKALEKSGYFKKVEVRYATKKEIENQKFTDFNIACFAF
ncbi:MAG: PilN domain-containing protein [Candidatus Omnitrophica bacterium]|nr:PilN domain-containing protein [Candidatus Omnitrophota bacterium]